MCIRDRVSGIKITLGLGQVDANAAQDAPALLLVAVADAFAQDTHLSLIPI